MAANQDEDMYLFDAGFSPNTIPFAGQTFEDLLPGTPASRDNSTASTAFLNPSVKQERNENIGMTNATSGETEASPSASDDSSQDSSSSSLRQHSRNVSENFTVSPSVQGTHTGNWGSGINGLTMPSGEDLFADTEMSGLDNDFEASNQQMASDFDFDTAASTPSGFGNTNITNPKLPTTIQPYRTQKTFNNLGQRKNHSPRLPAAQPSFFFGESRESSPLNAMLPNQGQSPWSKHSPSSGLEETFNGITMNGDSPGNVTFSPSMGFTNPGFTFDPDSSNTPSTFTKDISSPPSTINSTEGPIQLFVYPTSLKSRVETQIPIKMTLSQLPSGVSKLRLPSYTVSKPKFLAKAELDRSPEILELYTSLVCTSAMQDQVRLERAFARARGEELPPLARPSPASSSGSSSSKDDEDKPLNGGEVKICSGCIQRERKRASRKKQKKPDEEELFQKDEEKRVIVFNTNEIKEWVEPAKDTQGGVSGLPNNVHLPASAMQVELPMRIACYCRHQNEKLGFQVIFTIKDYADKVIAQAMTNSIMITDDHKTHNAPPPVSGPMNSLPNTPQVPGAGVFQTSGLDFSNGSGTASKMFKQSFSTTDLSGLKHNFNPHFPMTPINTPFAIPSAVSSATSTSLTPRNLSRPASPTGPTGPTTKRRKQSGSGKLPSNLTMTRLETAPNQGATSSLPNSAATSPYPLNMPIMMGNTDRGFAIPSARVNPFGTSPPTPSSHETSFVNRTFSLENLPRQAVISAPSSRQPSRPGSPNSNRNSFGGTDPNLGQAVSNQLFGTQTTRRPPPLIHKLVPAEGSITGGTEVTLLGNGFYHGLEVMFGDTEATTTTFWGEKCLNCIAPPALQPGTVSVVFKHEHPQYAAIPTQSQTRHPVFTYTDDREVEMYKLALKTLGKQMQHPTDDPYSAAQQLLGGPSPSFWPMQTGYGTNTGQHRQMNASISAPIDLLDLESNMLALIDFIDLHRASHPPKLNIRRPNGLTLLHLASSLGLTRIVAALLARGASPDILDKNGNTPMHHAAMNGHTHIIHRLRLAGADNRIRSIRNFTPADLATSLLAHQATVIPSHHYRSRSAGGTPMRLHSRNGSSTSLGLFWESVSTDASSEDEAEDSDQDEEDQIVNPAVERPIPVPRLPSGQFDLTGPNALTIRSRQGSGLMKLSPQVDLTTSAGQPVEQAPVSPAAFIAWRDQLAAQIHQFQESANWMLPNLPTLSALPALPDYQTYPVVRRVSSLFPQRPLSRQANAPGSKEGWWETLTGTSSAPAPPAYKDLYPEEPSEEDLSIKKRSAIQAAADAAIDLHFETQSSSSGPSSLNTLHETTPKLALPSGSGTRLLFEDRPIDRLSFRRDRKLFLFWIPLLALVLGLMLKNVVPDIKQAVFQGYDFLNTQFTNRIEEVA